MPRCRHCGSPLVLGPAMTPPGEQPELVCYSGCPDTSPAKCYDCLSTNVAVQIQLPAGFSIWLCAKDWAAQKQFAANLRAFLAITVGRLSGDVPA